MAQERLFTAAPISSAAGRVIVSPFQFIATGEDNLRVVCANSKAGVTVGIQGRWLSERGTAEAFAHTHIPTSDRSVTSEDYALGPGAIINVVAYAVAGQPLIGQTFISLQLVRGRGANAKVLGTLMQGYVTSSQMLAWPGSPVLSSTSGEPYVRTIVGTTPAAGADFAETCPTGARWELLRVYAHFQTSAVVFDRVTQLRLIQGGVYSVIVKSERKMVNLAVADFMWSANLPLVANPDDGGIIQQPLPDRTIMNAGDQFLTVTTTIQAADQWSTLAYVVREWLEVP